MRFTRHGRNGGFTLIELLVVIVILSLLAAMITPVVFSAINAAKEAQIKIEMAQLAMAIEDYKRVVGEYPPSDPGVAGINAINHLKAAFPFVPPDNYAAEVAAFDAPNKALWFYLSGVSKDPTAPYTGVGKKSFEWNAERLIGNVYYPLNETLTLPYVYTSDGTSFTITQAGLDDQAGTDDDLKYPE